MILLVKLHSFTFDIFDNESLMTSLDMFCSQNRARFPLYCVLSNSVSDLKPLSKIPWNSWIFTTIYQQTSTFV